MALAIFSVLEEVSHKMLSQGPLEFFVHHNTLHAFEGESFQSGLENGQVLYGAKVYKSTSEYKTNFDQGLIEEVYIQKRLQEHFAHLKGDQTEIIKLARSLLFTPSQENPVFSPAPNSLFLGPHRQKKEFYKETYLRDFAINIDDSISHTLLTFFASYFDQGYSYWPMPDRDKGMLSCYKAFIRANQALAASWMAPLAARLKNFETANIERSIGELLEDMHLDEQHWADYLFSIGYRYKGWGALNLSFLENKEWNRNPDNVKANFAEFMAILLLTELAILENIAATTEGFVKPAVPRLVFIQEYSDEFMAALNQQFTSTNRDLVQKIATHFRDIDRQYILQCAYEDSFYQKFLQSFADRQKRVHILPHTEIPKFQAITCIDDREESFRRYIEEVEPRAETLSVAGHFGLDIRYRGIFNAFPRALCPNIVTPTKNVAEELLENKNLRQFIGMWADFLWLDATGSKGLIRGYFMQFIVSIFAFFPLALSIFSPRLAAIIRKKVRLGLSTRLKTALRFQENEIDQGMKMADQINYAKNLLKTIGLTERFSPCIFLLGHGSASLNNPHENAYNCGACGGGRGAPNSRLMAKIINTKEVREGLKAFNIVIPDSTTFVGGYHNTCSDELIFFDTPKTEAFSSAIASMQTAAYLNSKERCRRFDDVKLSINDQSAISHVLSRASDYRQPRPEYNHATNAFCVVGPRELTRNLFMDRRAFLVSYNSKGDPQGEVLRNIMSAVGPVCSGINLEYYFSYVDNEVLGCGTKLPHNVTSLLGVMNGYESDLQLGLSAQMVEIHDPYRLMVVVAAPLDVVNNIIETLPSFTRLVKNQWIHLRVFEPTDKKLYSYEKGQFVELSFAGNSPIVKNNHSAFVGRRGSCEFASIGEERA